MSALPDERNSARYLLPMRRLVSIAMLCAAAAGAATASAQTGPLVAGHGQFLLNGKPFQIISGSMHYARVPREYWRDRMEKAKAMGLNTITTYVFWNFHEPTRGHYDFAGQRDIAAYLRTAQDVGLHVILRPGPYVCAEWELGGYPGWLFADTSIVLRSTDPRFTKPAEQWLDTLGKVVAPYLASRGGPIIAVQVENEYGSFDKDKAYLRWQENALKHAGFRDVLLYTADGDYQLPDGTLPGLPAVVNFGPGEADSAFARLARFKPGEPLMSGEYWAGWFDQWGQPHHTTNALRQTRELSWMLDRGYSVSIYMFHGGTTPGFMNGANIDGGHYHPQTSSYDYDAALDESGRPTPKYYMFRDAIEQATGVTPPPVPDTPEPITVPDFELDAMASLWDDLGTPMHAERPRNMEAFGQSYGYIVYRTNIPDSVSGELVVRDVRDYAQIYVNGVLQGTLDRRLGEDSMPLTAPAGARLDLLVENSGRVNFAKPLRFEEKGITHSVTLGGRALLGWDVYRLPLSSVPHPACPGDPGRTRLTDCWTLAPSDSLAGTDPRLPGPGYYQGTFDLTTTGDTFLDTRGWGKGTVWVNGHQLGRFWGIGPEQTLYVPGPWLREGRNDVVVFDLLPPRSRTLRGLDHPILDDLRPDDRSH
jgi:beta-galactosidase